MAFRVSSWARHHPLLFEMFKLKHGGDDLGQVGLGQAIVRRYLPPGESEPLVVRIDVTRERAVSLLGFDDEEPSPAGHGPA